MRTPKRFYADEHIIYQPGLILDSRVVDLRMVYTDDIPCPKSSQEPNVAGQYQEFNR